MEITKDDIEKIKQFSKDPNIYDTMIASILPNIKGHEDIKEAILLSLFMGSAKKLDEIPFNEGINILIAGHVHELLYSIKNLDKLALKDKFQYINTLNMGRDELKDMLVEDRSTLVFHEVDFSIHQILYEQLDLSKDILNDFDLIFLVEDKPDKKMDAGVAEHILDIHSSGEVEYSLDPVFFKKYIAYSYVSCKPVLTSEASDVLRDYYVNSRGNGFDEFRITPRHLEAIVRLAEASAKIKLKSTVDREDAEKAVRLQMTCLKKVGVNPETGDMNVEIMEGRMPRSDRDTIQRVTDEITILEEDFRYVPLNVLKSNMDEKYGVSEEKVDHIVSTLKMKGIIYEPDKGYVRRVS